jgi:hypothetical protein
MSVAQLLGLRQLHKGVGLAALSGSSFSGVFVGVFAFGVFAFGVFAFGVFVGVFAFVGFVFFIVGFVTLVGGFIVGVIRRSTQCKTAFA